MFLIKFIVNLFKTFLYGGSVSRSSAFNPITSIAQFFGSTRRNNARRKAKKKMTHLGTRFLSKRQARRRDINRNTRRNRKLALAT